VFVQRILFGNFTILNPQNNAEMDYKKNRYWKWELILRFCDDGGEPRSYIKVKIPVVHGWSRERQGVVLVTSFCCSNIFNFQYSSHTVCRAEIPRFKRKTHPTHSRSLSLTQTKVHAKWDPRLSQQWHRMSPVFRDVTLCRLTDSVWEEPIAPTLRIEE
jgi:hypothetical protein